MVALLDSSSSAYKNKHMRTLMIDVVCKLERFYSLEDAPIFPKLRNLRFILLLLLEEGLLLHVEVGQRSPTDVGWSDGPPDLGLVPCDISRDNNVLL